MFNYSATPDPSCNGIVSWARLLLFLTQHNHKLRGHQLTKEKIMGGANYSSCHGHHCAGSLSPSLAPFTQPRFSKFETSTFLSRSLSQRTRGGPPTARGAAAMSGHGNPGSNAVWVPGVGTARAPLLKYKFQTVIHRAKLGYKTEPRQYKTSMICIKKKNVP